MSDRPELMISSDRPFSSAQCDTVVKFTVMHYQLKKSVAAVNLY